MFSMRKRDAKGRSGAAVRRRRTRHAAVAGFLAMTGMAAAQGTSSDSASQPADRGGGRYTFQQTQDGVLRFDTQTGQISMCRTRDGKLTCEAATDERRSIEEEIARLRTENAELKKDVKRLEELSGIPAPPDPDKPGSSKGGVQLPTEEDLDKAMSYVQRMLKKFKDKLKEFESEMGKDAEPKKGTPL
ncbi:MAG TPA: hypothetical protein PK970_10980 [Hyphomicrobiaceae bacterium]|nr:hypothetical protein [Hyphomicrobiaceae bacterium]